MNVSCSNNNVPQFPGILSVPLKLLPSIIHSNILILFLNRLLSEQISEGDLDFIEQHTLLVNVSDMKLSFLISMRNQQLVSVKNTKNITIEIQACAYDFLQLASRQQDPDTLVFQRRLIMTGDTEIGLEIKNFLDGLDFENSASFNKIERLINKSLPIYQRLFG